MKASCFYCKTYARVQMDHFPVPARNGGTETVPACVTCHNLKDRIPIANWPSDVLWPACNLLLTTMIERGFDPDCLSSEVIPQIGSFGMRQNLMDVLTPMSRVLYAKFLSIASDHEMERVA